MSFKSPLEIIFSMKSKNVVVQLKNGFSIRGLLEDVDYFLNLKLSNITATDKNMKTFKRATAIYLRGNLISSIILEKNALGKLINVPKEARKMNYLELEEIKGRENELLNKKTVIRKKFKY